MSQMVKKINATESKLLADIKHVNQQASSMDEDDIWDFLLKNMGGRASLGVNVAWADGHGTWVTNEGSQNSSKHVFWGYIFLTFPWQKTSKIYKY